MARVQRRAMIYIKSTSTGDNALFSDSSDSEKHDFRKELTFPHPDNPKDSLFCTMHGKARHKSVASSLFHGPIK